MLERGGEGAGLRLRRRDLLGGRLFGAGSRSPDRSSRGPRVPNVELRTLDGAPLRFLDDVVRDRTVLVHVLYPHWKEQGLVVRNLEHVARLLERFDRLDLCLVSLLSESTRESRSAARAIAGSTATAFAWHVIGGDAAAVRDLRSTLGIGDGREDENAGDAPHAGVLTVGNGRTGIWSAVPALMDAASIARRVLRVASR